MDSYMKNTSRQTELSGFFVSEPESGIHFIICKNIIITKKHLQELYKLQLKMRGSNKVMMIVDLKSVKMFTIEGGLFAREKGGEYILGAAMISQTNIANMVISFFIKVIKPQFPIKVFFNYLEARAWLLCLENERVK